MDPQRLRAIQHNRDLMAKAWDTGNEVAKEDLSRQYDELTALEVSETQEEEDNR